MNQDRIEAFVKLGQVLKLALNNTGNEIHHYSDEVQALIKNQHLKNPWFSPENVKFALSEIASSLTNENLKKWIAGYNFIETEAKRVGVVLAGNLPAVGFHDFLSVLISGHKFIGKLSHDDVDLLPLLGRILVSIDQKFESKIDFTKEHLKDFDAVIATGSNNSARYFDYYFGKYPHIIRKNRNGVAVITGEESDKELVALGEDIFRYFGMGCRSVSKLFVPNKYIFQNFLDQLMHFQTVGDHHKYKNNYDYYKSIYLVNKEDHFDTGFLLLKENTGFSSPPSVLYYEYYNDAKQLGKQLNMLQDQIQCVVSGDLDTFENAVLPGNSQKPKLWDYADGVDTLEFLLTL